MESSSPFVINAIELSDIPRSSKLWPSPRTRTLAGPITQQNRHLRVHGPEHRHLCSAPALEPRSEIYSYYG